jgi:hypothetical protein
MRTHAPAWDIERPLCGRDLARDDHVYKNRFDSVDCNMCLHLLDRMPSERRDLILAVPSEEARDLARKRDAERRKAEGSLANHESLGTFRIELAGGGSKSFELCASVRQGIHVLEVRDASTHGKAVWDVFQLDAAPVAVEILPPQKP